MEKLEILYKKFSLAEGNQHIASEYAIRKIQGLVKVFKVKHILEIGLGIGSISGILLSINNHLKYSGTENNQFCLKALKLNLRADFKRLTISNSLKEVETSKKFDLIIIDGSDSDLHIIKGIIEPHGIICIEGDRIPQQRLIFGLFPKHKMVHSISLRKNKRYSPFPSDEWQGGLKIIFVNPTFGQYVYWMKEKLSAKIKYQFPGRHFGNKK